MVPSSIIEAAMNSLPPSAKIAIGGTLGVAYLAKTFCDKEVEYKTQQVRMDYVQKEVNYKNQILEIRQESHRKDVEHFNKEVEYKSQLEQKSSKGWWFS